MARRLPWRKASVPASLRQRVAVAADPGERILGWSWVGATGWAVATDRAFRASVDGLGASDAEPLVIEWSRVVRARWADGALEVVGSPSGGPAERFVFEVAEEGRLAEAVQVAVTDSLLWEQRIEDASGRGALVVGRRSESGETAWTVRFDAGVDPADPAVRAWADVRLDEIRQQTGL